MSETLDDTLNTLIGTLFMMGSILLCWYCLYRYAICQAEKEKSRRARVNTPKQQSLNVLI